MKKSISYAFSLLLLPALLAAHFYTGLPGFLFLSQLLIALAFIAIIFSAVTFYLVLSKLYGSEFEEAWSKAQDSLKVPQHRTIISLCLNVAITIVLTWHGYWVTVALYIATFTVAWIIRAIFSIPMLTETKKTTRQLLNELEP